MVEYIKCFISEVDELIKNIKMIQKKGGTYVRGEIRRKIDFLEVVSKGEEIFLKYFEELEGHEERSSFIELVNWGKRSKCITGIMKIDEKFIFENFELTNLGKEVYEGRKDLILR